MGGRLITENFSQDTKKRSTVFINVFSLPARHFVHLMSAMIVNTITWAMAHDVTDSGTDAVDDRWRSSSETKPQKRKPTYDRHLVACQTFHSSKVHQEECWQVRQC